MARKVYESEIKSHRKYVRNNKEKIRYINYRSACKSFIKKKATIADLQMLDRILHNRESEIQKQGE